MQNKIIQNNNHTFMNFVEELKWRGMIHQMMPGTEEQLQKEMTVAYLGIDPTADSLHIGHLVGVMMLKHLQRAGHKPIALVGGATGMIGDPSMKSQERKLLDEQTLRHNQEAIKRQLAKFLDFDSTEPYAAELVNNYDWMKQFSFLDFIRDVGKHITVNYMMAKDSVKKRLSGESQQGMSFTEFSYQLVQGYDFLCLYRDKGCRLQLGGSDQWGNLTSGLDLIHKVRGVNVNVMASPIITDANGKKFGKSEGNAVWLDPTMLSPYRFYQFWINRPDAEMESLLKAFTFLPKQEIERLMESTATNPGAREAQRVLAWEVTSLVHGEDATRQAIEASAALFGRGGDLAAIGVDTLEAALDGLKVENEEGAKVFATATVGERVSEAGVRAGLFKSISEARKTIASGGVYLNNARVEDQERLLGVDDFLQGRFALIRRGKKALGVVELG